MTVVETIMAELGQAFAERDAALAVRNIEWAQSRCEAIKAFKANPTISWRDEHRYYGELFSIAGGKTWYNVFQYGWSERVEAFVNKNTKSLIDKRNATIAKKLTLVGVREVVSSSHTWSSDGGFDGNYTVMTDAGEKTISIRTIIAGGYNIQSLHNRTLVKVN